MRASSASAPRLPVLFLVVLSLLVLAPLALTGCASSPPSVPESYETGWRVEAMVSSATSGTLTHDAFKGIPFVYYKLKEIRSGTRLAWIVVTDFDKKSLHGITPPAVASQKTVAAVFQPLQVNSSGPLFLDRGCVIVEMAPKPMPEPPDAEPLRLAPSAWGWMYAITRGLSTGAFSSSYVLAATSEPIDPDGRYQACYASEGSVVAGPSAAPQQMAWLDPGKTAYLYAPADTVALPTQPTDSDGMVKMAMEFMRAVRAQHGD